MSINPVNLLKNLTYQEKLSVYGLKKEKLKLQKQMVDIEDISTKKMKKNVIDKKLSILESPQQNRNQALNDKLISYKKNIQDIKLSPTLVQVSITTGKDLKDLWKESSQEQIEEIVVAYKDRLCRFGFEIIEQFCKHFSTTITVVNDSDTKSEESELAEDIISIITVFSARFHGRRKYRNSKLRNKKISNLPKSTTTKVI